MVYMRRSHTKDPRRLGLCQRRGLSTVVTTALMLTTVAVLGSAIVAWSNGNLSVFENALSATAASDTNQITENLNIENVAFCHNCGITQSNNVTNVTLTNTGTVGINVTQIQINGTIVNSFYYSQTAPYSSSLCIHVNGISYTGTSGGPPTCLPAVILPQQSYQVSATLPDNTVWKSKDLDTVSVTTARGSIFTTQVAPP